MTKPATPSAAKRTPRPVAVTRHGPRADFGKPIDSFFRKQVEPLRSILVELRNLVEAAAPDATASIKWGMPVYEIGGKMFVALGAHKAHVNLILTGPPNAYQDPDGLLTGESKRGRHLKLTTLDGLPRARIRSWLATCARLVRTT